VAIYEALSIYGNGPPYFLGFAIMFNWYSRGRAFYYICFLSAVAYLMNITKMAYHEPRPFMWTTKVKVFGCTAEYGNPSGHALFAAGGHFFIFLDICHGRKSSKFSKPVYAILLFLTVSLSALVGYARFYVGVHTINQIVYGWSLGIFLAFYFHICLRDTIIDHVDRYLLSRKHNMSIDYKKVIITNSLVVAVAFGTQVATFLITQLVID
jgi:membrane-associated phospholipid phosphatase